MWLRELVSENKTGRLSSARAISLAAGWTLSFSTVLLTIGAFWHPEMLSTLMAFGPSLAGLAATNYGMQLWSGTKNDKST